MAGDWTGGRTAWANGIQEAVEDVALVYMQRGMSAKEAAGRAAKEIITDQYHDIDASYRVPKGVDREKVADFALKKMHELGEFDILPPAASNPELRPEYLQEDYVRAVQRQGYWTNNEDDTGLVLMNPKGAPVADKNGRLYEFSFEEAEKYTAPPIHFHMPQDLSKADGKKLYLSSRGEPYRQMISSASTKYGLDQALLARVIGQESGWNPKAVSKAGALGLMQLMPATARDMGVSDPEDPAQNIDGGAKYLARLIRRFNDKTRALVAYNWGPKHAEKWDGKLASLPDETREYLKKVLG